MKGKATSLFRQHTLKTLQAISKTRNGVVLAVQSMIFKKSELGFWNAALVFSFSCYIIIGGTVRFHEIFCQCYVLCMYVRT
jgi:hypothetical protein